MKSFTPLYPYLATPLLSASFVKNTWMEHLPLD